MTRHLTSTLILFHIRCVYFTVEFIMNGLIYYTTRNTVVRLLLVTKISAFMQNNEVVLMLSKFCNLFFVVVMPPINYSTQKTRKNSHTLVHGTEIDFIQNNGVKGHCTNVDDSICTQIILCTLGDQVVNASWAQSFNIIN